MPTENFRIGLLKFKKRFDSRRKVDERADDRVIAAGDLFDRKTKEDYW